MKRMSCFHVNYYIINHFINWFYLLQPQKHLNTAEGALLSETSSSSENLAQITELRREMSGYNMAIEHLQPESERLPAE